MQKIKKLLAVLVCMVMVAALAPGLTAWAEETADGLEYEVYDGHVEITGYTGNATVLDIPAEIGGLPVTSIGSSAFSENISLVNINLPDSVTEIGEHAFQNCASLEKIHISESVKLIGDFAFGRCDSLQYIDVEKNNASYCSEVM